ncbi:ATP-binding protein [Thalassotalea aquiviva]|uniref:ATP-binding protein n=1 Tax=Thalassotalea aquiviva TaxID=3242415 RepID=UPI00352BC194
MSGLKRIILIDTHLPGLVELQVDGHTNICGTNASGKTTLQRLVPVFYGESPNKVVPATRDNFQTWYLPRESSFIIFEYQRLDNRLCMTVLSSSATGVVYRFVDKGFESSDFIGKDITGTRSIAVAEIFRSFRRQQIVTSKALNTKEYRAIIQNDRAVMALSSNKRELLSSARFFSLCESHARLRHVEKLIKAVHSKEGKMETIKAMIAAILEEDGVETPTNKLSKKQLDDWIKECLLIKEFQQLMPQYDKLKQVNASLVQTESRLAQLAELLSLDLSRLSESIVKAESDRDSYKSQLTRISKEFEEQRDELNQRISAARGEATTAEKKLDQIDDEFNNWQDLDIETHAANLDNVSAWQSQHQSLTEQHALLTAEHQDIEAAYHKRLAELEKKHNKDQVELNSNKDQARSQLQQVMREESNALQELKEKQEQRRSEIKDDFDRQINQANLNIERVSTQIQLSGPTSSEQEDMALLQANLQDAQLDEDHARTELQNVQQRFNQLKTQQLNANEQLHKARHGVGVQQQKVDQIYAWLYPGDKTLLEFLRKERPGWEAELGKIINPELLSRTDLAPMLSPDKAHANSVFGVLLDTNAIAETDILQTESQLQKQLEIAQQDLQAAQNGQAEIEANLVKLNAQVKDLELQHTQLLSQCQFKEQGRKRIQDEVEQLKAQHKQALAERKLKHQQQLQALTKAMQKLQLNKADALESDDEQIHDEKMEHELHWQQLANDIETKIEQIEQQRQNAEQQYKEGIKSCKQWYKNELASREVDVDQISLLKQQLSQLKEQIDITNKYRDKVSEYKRWYTLVFTEQKAEQTKQLSHHKDQKAKAERLLVEKAGGFKSQKKQLQEQISQLEEALSEQNEQVQRIKQVKPQLALLALPQVTFNPEQSSIGARISETQELIEAQSRASHDISAHVSHFDNLIGQKSGISLTEAWEHARKDCFISNAQGIETLDHRKMISELDSLLTVMVPQHLEGVRNNGLNFGNDLTQYYNILADIDKRIESQSRRITKEVDKELFLDGVSQSSVRIRSKISEFDFWPKLLRFNKLHQAWLRDDNAPLPDQEYTDTIREVQEVLGRTTISGGIGQFLDIELHLKEGNSDLYIRTDRQLNESSSHGMAYLILCKFLLAFTRLLRGDSEVIVHWPIDEIGTLANKNVKKIFDACLANNITVIGAFPNPESDVLHFFTNRYLIDKDAKEQKLRKVTPKVNPISERLKQRQQAQQIGASL